MSKGGERAEKEASVFGVFLTYLEAENQNVTTVRVIEDEQEEEMKEREENSGGLNIQSTRWAGSKLGWP